MTGDVLSFALLSISSILIPVNPLGPTLLYVSLTTNMEPCARDIVARDTAGMRFLFCSSLPLSEPGSFRASGSLWKPSGLPGESSCSG